MSAPVDTPEVVERKASILGTMALYNFGEGSAGRDILNNAAAMLRRLHARATEAERERDNIAANTVRVVQSIQEAAATYRAERDEARAALDKAYWIARAKDDDIADAILALIKKEPK